MLHKSINCIRYKITCLQIYLSYIEQINHLSIKQRLGILYRELDNILDELDSDNPNFKNMETKLELIDNLARQI